MQQRSTDFKRLLDMLVNYFFFWKSNLSKYPRCAGIRVLSSAAKQPCQSILHPTNFYKLADKKLESLLQSWNVVQLPGQQSQGRPRKARCESPWDKGSWDFPRIHSTGLMTLHGNGKSQFMMQTNCKSWEREEEGTGVLSAFVAAEFITFLMIFTPDRVEEFLLSDR